MSTSSPRIFPAKNRQVGEDDIKFTSSPRQSDKNTSSKNRQDGEDDIMSTSSSTTFPAKNRPNGEDDIKFTSSPRQKKGAGPRPIKGVRLS